jgi:ribosome-associated toxin RatA of RatAB toxin-antitoxin module
MSRWLSLAAVLLGSCMAHDPNSPHNHNGVFRPYRVGPPKKAGLILSKADKQKLQDSGGEPTSTVVALSASPTSPSGTMRCTSVQEIDAPPSIVWELLLDYANYPKFVSGISSCKPYSKRRTLTGGQIACAQYTVSLGPAFKVNYYLDHHYEPLQNSMVWHLDYTRKSDVFDSVGYWYVEALEKDRSRVYYTQDSLLPSWIPKPVRKSFTKIAMKSATKKLGPACTETMRKKEGPAFLRRLKSMQLPRFPKVGGGD